MRRLFQKNPINIKFEIYSFRNYGQPKLKKPKELKGVKQIFSVDYIPKKCKCQIFILNNDIWIKHKDYFSEAYKTTPEESGMPLNYFAEKFMGKSRSPKFIYEDAWGSVIFRNEAWIRISNLANEVRLDKFELDIINEIRNQQEKLHGFKKNELCCSAMERFWEGVVKKLKSCAKE